MGLNREAIALLALAANCCAVSAYFTFREIEEINHKVEEQEKISYLFMYPGKMQKIKAEYNRLFPDGRIDRWRMIFQVAMFVFLALTAVAGGFLR